MTAAGGRGGRVVFAVAFLACVATVVFVHRQKNATRSRMHRAVELDRAIEREEKRQQQAQQQPPPPAK
jgi:hypothetical protein